MALVYLEDLNRFLAPFFQKLPRTNIETNTQDARMALESLFVSLKIYEQIVSPDVKILYTKVAVGKATEIAPRYLYSHNLAPETTSE